MPDRIVLWATHGKVRVGPKQLFVIAAAVLCILRGVGYIGPPPVPAGLATLSNVAPLQMWGWGWIIAGVVALAAIRWRHYAIALTPMLIFSALWSFSYTAEWAVTLLWREGDSRDWITGVSYAFQAAAVLIVSRLIDPTEVTGLQERPDA